jgi:hypothetical protein
MWTMTDVMPTARANEYQAIFEKDGRRLRMTQSTARAATLNAMHRIAQAFRT